MAGPVADADAVGKGIDGKTRIGNTRVGLVRIGAADIERFVRYFNGNLTGDAVADTLFRDHGQLVVVDKAFAAIGEEDIDGVALVAEVAVAIGEAEVDNQGIGRGVAVALGNAVFVEIDLTQHRLLGVVGRFDAGIYQTRHGDEEKAVF